jgi:chaperonin GroES
MKLKPFGERIVVKQKEEELTTASGIVLAKQAEKKFEGVIVAAGQGAILDNGTVRAMTVKVGDTILFGEYSGQKFKYEDEDYLLMNEKDVIGILNE